jgi:LPS-assembly lipoprotein
VEFDDEREIGGRLAACAGLVQTSGMIRRSLPIVLALALSACGFHLRDELVLPTDTAAVRVASVDPYSPLADSLTESIRRAGATVAESGDGNATVLDLLSERWGDTPNSVDQFGRAQEYSLRYAVVFELRRADGTKLVPRQAVELSREYVKNPVNAVGTESEREILVKELRRDMAASIVRRLGTVVRAVAAADATPESRLDEPVAEDAAKAALEAADANPPPDEPVPEATPANPPQPR